jgi:hypothetical protein
MKILEKLSLLLILLLKLGFFSIMFIALPFTFFVSFLFFIFKLFIIFSKL